MNIKPFRLTAGAYLLSKDMRGREREREKFFVKENTELLFQCHLHTAEISIQYNGIILFVSFFHFFSAQSPDCRQKLSSTFSLSLYRCAIVKIALERKEKQNEWHTSETAFQTESINPPAFIGFCSKICSGLAAI